MHYIVKVNHLFNSIKQSEYIVYIGTDQYLRQAGIRFTPIARGRITYTYVLPIFNKYVAQSTIYKTACSSQCEPHLQQQQFKKKIRLFKFDKMYFFKL